MVVSGDKADSDFSVIFEKILIIAMDGVVTAFLEHLIPLHCLKVKARGTFATFRKKNFAHSSPPPPMSGIKQKEQCAVEHAN